MARSSVISWAALFLNEGEILSGRPLATTEPSCQLGARRSVDRCDVSAERRTIDGATAIDGGRVSGGRPAQSGLQRLEQALARDETLQTAGLDSLVLLLGKLGQPIGGSSQILAQHRAACDHLVLDCLLDQLVLTDAQSGGDLSGQSPKLFVTPTQWEYSSRCHASSMSRLGVMSRRAYDIIADGQLNDRTSTGTVDLRCARHAGISGDQRCTEHLRECDVARVVGRKVVAKLPATRHQSLVRRSPKWEPARRLSQDVSA